MKAKRIFESRQKPPRAAPSFAAKATDLQALRDAVDAAATVGGGLWLSYLFTSLYLAIAAGAVTHKDLFLESPVKLPFLNVELPLLGFFALAPLLFVILHAYTLLHFAMLADKVGAFDEALREQIDSDLTRTRLRRQLPSNIFVQFLAGPRELRRGAIGWMLQGIALISLVIGPIALLVFFQLQFLPYHDWATSWSQRLLIVADLALLWLLWPAITGLGRVLRWRDLLRPKPIACGFTTLLTLLLVFTIATFPGELLHEHLPSIKFPRFWETAEGETSLHELLVAGGVDGVRQRPQSLLRSNRLVLPGVDVIDRAEFDSDAKFSAVAATVSFRGRNLEKAILIEARLRKVDFTGALLKGARFTGADLRYAKFECDVAGDKRVCADLQGASLDRAQLQGASLNEANLQGALLTFANLQGASLNGANLQGAKLAKARLKGAELRGAQLQGADLPEAQLQGASLNEANLQGAELRHANLQGASLSDANLQCTSLNDANLQGASLTSAQLQGAELRGARLQGTELTDAGLQGAELRGAQLQGADLSGAQLQGASLEKVFVWRAVTSHMNADGARVVGPETAPKFQAVGRVRDWRRDDYVALRQQIEKEVLAETTRDVALIVRIARLDPEDASIDANLDSPASRWLALEKASPPRDRYEGDLAGILKATGCAAEGAPYVVRGIGARLRSPFSHQSGQH